MTNWRDIGDTSQEVWTAELDRASSPVQIESVETYRAVHPHTRLALAMCYHESQYGTAFNLNKPENKNPMNLKHRAGSGKTGFMRFDTYADGFAEWKARLLDPTYAYAQTVTLDDLVNVYAPSSDNNVPAAYVAALEAHIRMQQEKEGVVVAIPTKPDQPTPVIYDLATDYARFGLTATEAKKIIAKRFTNRYDSASGLTGREEFIFLHSQMGATPGSLKHWLTVSASSTVMIQKDGSILRVIPEAHGPWTNGDVINPQPQAAEVLAMGGNPNIWSDTIEFEGWYYEALTPEQLSAAIWQCQTWIIANQNILDHGWSIHRHRHINTRDKWRCPDDDEDGPASLRFTPVVDGINTWLEGTEIPPIVYATPKSCPKVDGLDHLPFVAITRKVTVRRGGGAECFAWGDADAPASGPNLFGVQPIVYMFKNDDGRWYVHEDGHRMKQSHFEETFTYSGW